MSARKNSKEVVDDFHEHEYEEIIVPPTCTEKGYTLHRCFCGYEYKDKFVNAQHNFVLVDEKAPSCGKKGYAKYECSVCGEVMVKEMPALSHKFSKWIEQKRPTCTEPGVEVRKCFYCEKTEKREKPPLDHKFTEWRIEGENKVRDCVNCGLTETINIKEEQKQIAKERRKEQRKQAFEVAKIKILGVFLLLLGLLFVAFPVVLPYIAQEIVGQMGIIYGIGSFILSCSGAAILAFGVEKLSDRECKMLFLIGICFFATGVLATGYALIVAELLWFVIGLVEIIAGAILIVVGAHQFRSSYERWLPLVFWLGVAIFVVGAIFIGFGSFFNHNSYFFGERIDFNILVNVGIIVGITGVITLLAGACVWSDDWDSFVILLGIIISAIGIASFFAPRLIDVDIPKIIGTAILLLGVITFIVGIYKIIDDYDTLWFTLGIVCAIFGIVVSLIGCSWLNKLFIFGGLSVAILSCGIIIWAAEDIFLEGRITALICAAVLCLGLAIAGKILGEYELRIIGYILSGCFGAIPFFYFCGGN